MHVSEEEVHIVESNGDLHPKSAKCTFILSRFSEISCRVGSPWYTNVSRRRVRPQISPVSFETSWNMWRSSGWWTIVHDSRAKNPHFVLFVAFRSLESVENYKNRLEFARVDIYNKSVRFAKLYRNSIILREMRYKNSPLPTVYIVRDEIGSTNWQCETRITRKIDFTLGRLENRRSSKFIRIAIAFFSRTNVCTSRIERDRTFFYEGTFLRRTGTVGFHCDQRYRADSGIRTNIRRSRPKITMKKNENE